MVDRVLVDTHISKADVGGVTTLDQPYRFTGAVGLYTTASFLIAFAIAHECRKVSRSGQDCLLRRRP